MTTALTAVGTQQVSITIASGSLTGTASISAVGSGAFITFQGQNATESAAQNDDTLAYVTISGTTLTATRGVTGSSQTVTVNVTVTDGDTTNLIKSVQQGTAAITSTNLTGTATISAVTTANASVGFLGQDVTTTSNTFNGCQTALTQAGTTVTATRQTGSSLSITTGWTVIEFQGTALNSSVQRISNSSTATGTSRTSTISSVTTANTMLVYGGKNGPGSNPAAAGEQYAQLTSATVITISWNTSVGNTKVYNCSVTEFVSAMLNQSVQRGTIALAAATSNTATITSSLVAETLVNWLGNSSTSTSINYAVESYKIVQTSATVITMSANSSASGTGSYEAIDFNPAATGTLLTMDFGIVLELLVSVIDNDIDRLEVIGTIKSDILPLLESVPSVAVQNANAPLESLVRVVDDDIDRMEFLFKAWHDDISRAETTGNLQMDSTLPSEFQEGVTSNVISRAESVAGQQGNAITPITVKGTITSDSIVPLELLSKESLDLILPAELLPTVQNDAKTPLTVKATQQADTIARLEWAGVVFVTADSIIPLESVSAVRNDAALPLESIATFTSNIVQPEEALASVQSNTNIRDEGLATQKADSIPLEWIGSQLTHGILPSEFMAGQRTDYLARDESLAGVQDNDTDRLEWRASIFSDASARGEWMGAQQVNWPLPFETGVGLNSNAGIVLEALATAGMHNPLRMEFMGTFISDRGMPSESLARIFGENKQYLEWVTLVTQFRSDTFLPFEFLQSAGAHAVSPDEVLLRIAGDVIARCEFSGIFIPTPHRVIVVPFREQVFWGGEVRTIIVPGEKRTWNV